MSDTSGGVFISYRRLESGHVAGRLYDRLADHFGTDAVFIDVDTIEPGIDFTQAINRAVATCNVLLAIIGPDWLTATDEIGRRRIDNPDDIVRLEIATALARDVRVIPVLVDNAVMPRRPELPEALAGLGRRNAFVINQKTFRYDAERLVATLEGIVSSGHQGTKRSSPYQEPRLDEPASQPEKWQLKLVIDEGATKTFQLSSGSRVHEIVVQLGWSNERIEIDGRAVADEKNIAGKEYSLRGLSIGSDSVIKVHRGSWATLRLKSLILKIGGQVVTYESGIR